MQQLTLLWPSGCIMQLAGALGARDRLGLHALLAYAEEEDIPPEEAPGGDGGAVALETGKGQVEET